MTKDDARAMSVLMTMNAITELNKSTKDDRTSIKENTGTLFGDMYKWAGKHLNIEAIINQLLMCSTNPNVSASILFVMQQFNTLFARVPMIEAIPIDDLREETSREWIELFEKIRLDLNIVITAVVIDASSANKQALLSVLVNTYSSNSMVDDYNVMSSDIYQKTQKMYYEFEGLDEKGQPKPVQDKRSKNQNEIPGLGN